MNVLCVDNTLKWSQDIPLLRSQNHDVPVACRMQNSPGTPSLGPIHVESYYKVCILPVQRIVQWSE